MKIRVLGAYGAEGLGQRPTSFLVNDRILIDAGTVGGALTMPEQTHIEHALITHSHLDHVAGLAFLTETLAFSETRVPLTVASLMKPDLLRRELDKLPPDLPVWIYHIKPQFYDEIVDELSRVDAGHIIVLEQDKTYTL